MSTQIFEIVVIITNAMVAYLVYRLKKRDKKKDLTEQALTILLRRELTEMYGELKEKETITMTQFNDFADVYNVYHELGGNGSGTHMFEKIKEKEIENAA